MTLNTYEGNRFIKKVIYDSDTGSEVSNPEFSSDVDWEVVKRKEALDDYYLIRSNMMVVLESGQPFTSMMRWHASDGLLKLNRTMTELDIVDMYRAAGEADRYQDPVKTMVESLRKANFVLLEHDMYADAYCDNVIEAIGNAIGLDLTK